MDLSTIVGTVSLAVEVTVLVLLTIGVSFKNRKKFRHHGITMAVALSMHIITILTVMIPSLVLGFGAPGTIDLRNWLVIVALLHAALGTIAAFLGAFPVLSWHFKADVQTCFAKKKIMLAAIALWVTSFLLGVPMYISFYATRLLG